MNTCLKPSYTCKAAIAPPSFLAAKKKKRLVKAIPVELACALFFCVLAHTPVSWKSSSSFEKTLSQNQEFTQNLHLEKTTLAYDPAVDLTIDPDGRCVEKGREAVHNAEENISYSWNQAENQSDADIGARILAGIPVSILSGDTFTRYTTPGEYLAQNGSMPMAFSANGIFASGANIVDMRTIVARKFNLSRGNVFSIENPSYGPLDLIRAAGQEGGAIDITALRAADMINASGGGIFIAHSNASALFYAASALLRPEVKANITYKGYGPQININATNDPGLRSYYNNAGSNDWVARGLNPNAHWDRIIPQSPLHPLNNHGFKETYASEVY